jgi:hypothetical protein
VSVFGVGDSDSRNSRGFRTTIAPFVEDERYLQVAPDGTLWSGSLGSGLWQSPDGGRTWLPKSQGLRDLMIDLLRVAPWDPPSPGGPRWLYAATSRAGGRGNGGFFLSTDAGETWQPLHPGQAPFPPRTPFTSMDLGRDALGRQHLWATASYSLSDCGQLFHSEDGGLTWCAFESACSSDVWSPWLCPTGVGDMAGGAAPPDDGWFVRAVDFTYEVYYVNAKQHLPNWPCDACRRSETMPPAWRRGDVFVLALPGGVPQDLFCEWSCQDQLRPSEIAVDPEDTEIRFTRHHLRASGIEFAFDLAGHDGSRNLRGEREWRRIADLSATAAARRCSNPCAR